MPDHVHIVVAATTEQSDLQRFVNGWKQRSAYEHKRQTGEQLWQESYFDHVLRDDEETETAIRYVLENPVRKGMLVRFEDYPASGSDTYTNEQLRQFWQIKQG